MVRAVDLRDRHLIRPHNTADSLGHHRVVSPVQMDFPLLIFFCPAGHVISDCLQHVLLGMLVN